MATLSISLKPSIQLTIILSLAHFSTAFLLWQLMLPISIKLISIIILAAGMVYYLRYHALLKSAESVVAFELSETLECTLVTRRGKRVVCTILGSTFVTPYLLVLNLKSLNKAFACSVVILADGIDAEKFRQLRVLLRWKWKTV